MTTYYYILMSQKRMLQNEVLEEILRERTTYYVSKSKTIDFWLSISPNFIEDLMLNKEIEKTNFFKQQQNEIKTKKNSFYGAIISSNKEFIKWIKLRIGYFEELNEKNRIEPKEYISDGITGSIKISEIQKDIPCNFSLLSSIEKHLHPEILKTMYIRSLETYYSLGK